MDKIAQQCGGGYLNHKLLFATMAPTRRPIDPECDLGVAVRKAIGSIDAFLNLFLADAVALFGSDFTWFVFDNGNSGSLPILRIPNQDNPVMANNETRKNQGIYGRLVPMLSCDCWEHAWYYQYGPKKKERFPEWWDSIDWPVVDHIYSMSVLA